MGKRVLITGGAGFIGSHLADELLAHGYQVRALDSLIPQVHGPNRSRPDYLSAEVELIVGDVRDAAVVSRALEDVDAVFHFAARVGVGQSMYEVRDYTEVNNLGTAVLLEAVSKRPVERLLVASSMSIYGEGMYRGQDGRIRTDVHRTVEQLKSGSWEPADEDGRPLEPIPTTEKKPPHFSSVYALSKFDQERTCLMLGQAYGIPTVALRFFNAYGTRQALSNPYTGVLAIFASRILNGKSPLIFEDGNQRRDFVNIRDVAAACRLALEVPAAAGGIFNVGSGRVYRVRDIARSMAKVIGCPELHPEITHNYRVGDIRHCFPDISLARETLGYEPHVELAEGLAELAAWLEGQVAVDRVEEMTHQLSSRGLTMQAEISPPRAPVESITKRIGIAKPARAPRQRPVLITGGAGFIGSNLADRLLGAGREVVIFDNFSRPGSEINAEWLEEQHGDRVHIEVGDVRDRKSVRRVVREAGSIFHFAAQVAVTTSLVDPAADFEVNAQGTLNVLEELRRLDRERSLFLTSTNKVYGGLPDLLLEEGERRYQPVDIGVRERGISEARRLDFHSPYGCSKGTADSYVIDYARTFGVRATVFRMSCIYGPRQFGTEDQGWVAHFLIRALDGKPITIYGDGKQVRDLLFVDDLVDAFLLAEQNIEVAAGHAFNMGGGPGNAVSLRELLELIAEVLGSRPNYSCDAWRVDDQRYYVSDTSRFRSLTGWTARRSYREGLRALHRWLVEERLRPAEQERKVS